MIDHLLLIIVLSAAAALSVFFRKLTLGAALLGLIFAICIFIANGYLSLIMMALFFLLATLATAIGAYEKSRPNLPRETGPRTAAQVMANAGLPAIISVSCLLGFLPTTYGNLLIAGAFVAATADTVSSEIGNRYGTRFIDLKTISTGQRGENGVISFEGSFAGLIASSIPAAGFAYANADLRFFISLSFAGILGNLTDSLLGAFAERKQRLNNNQVNFIMTFSGAFWAFLVHEWLR